MPHELPKAYDPAAIEEHWAEYWVRENLFHTTALDESTAQRNFTMLLPPPNVTGNLHMGHMFEQTESDILMRWHRMRGDRTLWVPGTDHAGIATQMLVERQLATEKTSRQKLGREAFLERVWKWKEQYGGAILDQMKRLGASVDWSREYFTMDAGLSRAVREAFVRLHEQGLIYRGAYIVNWCPGLPDRHLRSGSDSRGAARQALYDPLRHRRLRRISPRRHHAAGDHVRRCRHRRPSYR